MFWFVVRPVKCFESGICSINEGFPGVISRFDRTTSLARGVGT